MGKLSMRPIHGAPLLSDRQDLLHLTWQQPVDGVADWSEVLKGAQVALAGAPAVHPFV